MTVTPCWACAAPIRTATRKRFCTDTCHQIWWETPRIDLGESEHVLIGHGTLTWSPAEALSGRWGAVGLTGTAGRLALPKDLAGTRGTLVARVLDEPDPDSGMIGPASSISSAWRIPAQGETITLGHGALFFENESGGGEAVACGVRPAWTDPRLGWLNEVQLGRLPGRWVALEVHGDNTNGVRAFTPSSLAAAGTHPDQADGDGEPRWRADYRVRLAAMLTSAAADYLHRPDPDIDAEVFTIYDDTGTVTVAAPSQEEYRRLGQGRPEDDLAGVGQAVFGWKSDPQTVTIRALCADTRFTLLWAAGADVPTLQFEPWPHTSQVLPELLEQLHANRPRGPRPRSGTEAHRRDWRILLAACVSAIPDGRWTTFGDLGEAIGGYHQREVGSYLGKAVDLPGRHRVLLATGKARTGGLGAASAEEQTELLRTEGVYFSPAGRADLTQRLYPDELRALAAARPRI